MSHSWFSASSSSRWLICPGSSVVDTSHLPPRPQKAADRGTLLHGFGELFLSSVEGHLPDQDDGWDELGDEERASVRTYVDYVQERGGDQFYEFHTMLCDQCGGTSDAVVITNEGRHLEIIDYKAGRWAVPAKENRQLLIYAAGVLKELHFLYDQIEEVTLTIIQPAVSEAPDSWTLGANAVREIGENITKRVRHIMEGLAEFVADEDACMWCDAKPICPEFSRAGVAAAKIQFTGSVDREDEPDQMKETQDIAAILEKDPDELTWADKKQLAPLAYAWAKMVDSQIKDLLLEDGDAVPGYKVVEGVRRRAWANDETRAEAEDHLLGYGFGRSELYGEAPFVSPAQAEKLFKGKGAGELKATLKPFIIKSDGAPTVVLESDERPPIDRAEMAARDFRGDLGEEESGA